VNPRKIIAGTYLLTRRTTQRQFLLRPSKEVNACIRYCLAVAQARSGVRVHCVVFLSNHYHIVVTDVLGKVPEFTEELNKLLARALNCHHGRWENFWASSVQTNQVELVDAQDVLDKLTYSLANPTEALLVSHGKDWPGVRLYRKGDYKAKKPKFFFRTEDAGGKLPDTTKLVLTPPPIGVQAKLCDDVVKHAASAREKVIRDRAHAAGKTFLEASKVKRQGIYSAPRKPAQKRGLSPRVACRDKWHRIEVLRRLSDFISDYKEKRLRYVAGETDVVFPAGTYKMSRELGVCCEQL